MTNMQLFLQSVRMTRRDWRAGELRLLMLALVLAVAAVSSVGFFVDRLQRGLQQDAAQLLGADLVVASGTPLSEDWVQYAQGLGLRTAQTVVFPSMAISGRDVNAAQLISAKAVSDAYPLRGALRVQSHADPFEEVVEGGPRPGTVWVDAQALRMLGLTVGDNLHLGERVFQIDRIITVELDRGMSFANFAPRVMLHLVDLPSTQLIAPGGRVTYRFLMAGGPNQVREMADWLRPRLSGSQKIESLEEGQPQMQRTLQRAEQFLTLVALLTALVAAVAVGSVARRFTERHLDACAMMRCLGLAQGKVFVLFLLEFVWIGIVSCVLGALAGWGLHFVLLEALRDWVPAHLPPPSIEAAIYGGTCGLVLLLGFALPPLTQLRHVPPLRVLRKDALPITTRPLAGYVLGAATFGVLLLGSATDFKAGWVAVIGFLGMVGVFGSMAWLLLWALGFLRVLSYATGRVPGVTWRFALAGMLRRRTATVVQLVSLAVGLMALLLLTVIRTDLIGAWRHSLPADAPNRFLINIQPDQSQAVAKRLHSVGVRNAELYPMVRGRLIQINGRSIAPEDYENDRAQRLIQREFNLSYMSKAPEHNRITAGLWFDPNSAALSIEEGIAKTLGVKLGDTLTFDIAGRLVQARTTSMRAVRWDSMQANFFVILTPHQLSDQPQTFITAFYLPPSASSGWTAELLRDFPNLTLIDTGAILRQVQVVLEQVIAAVEFLFLFTLGAGVLVLYAALSATHDERRREAALLRALGATRAQLRWIQAIELFSQGGLAGLLAAWGATTVGWVLARTVFEFDFTVSLWVFVLGIGAGAVSAGMVGWLGLRHVVNVPPMASLRQA